MYENVTKHVYLETNKNFELGKWLTNLNWNERILFLLLLSTYLDQSFPLIQKPDLKILLIKYLTRHEKIQILIHNYLYSQIKMILFVKNRNAMLANFLNRIQKNTWGKKDKCNK